MRTIAKIVKSDIHAVYRWIKAFAKDNYEKSTPTSNRVVVKLDEMWHYVNSKKQTLDMEGLLSRYPSTYRPGVRRAR